MIMDMVEFREPFEYKPQKRKEQGRTTWNQYQIGGADFETKDGNPHIFTWTIFDRKEETYKDYSFTFGGTVEEPDLFLEANGGNQRPAFDLELFMDLLFQTGHFSEGGWGKRRKPPELYFFNLQYDAQAIIKTLPVSVIERLFNGDTLILDKETWLHEPEAKRKKISNPNFGKSKNGQRKDKRKKIQRWFVGDRMMPFNRYIQISYLPKKYLSIEPLMFYTKGVKWAKVDCWDIRPFLGGGSLNFNAKKHLGEEKLDFTSEQMGLMGSLSPEGVAFSIENEEKILEYAEKDANLTARLAWKTIHTFESNDVRMIKPFSPASVAERAALDLCTIPTINDEMEAFPEVMMAFWTGYQGGWFEAVGSGMISDCRAFDITSAYPHVMWWLPDTSDGAWIGSWFGDPEEEAQEYLDHDHEPYSLAIIEAEVHFPEGLRIYPAAKISDSAGCLMNPRSVYGFFTGDEIKEFEKWGAEIHTERWAAFIPTNEHEDALDVEDGVRYPFRPFIKTFYSQKLHQDQLKESGSDEYDPEARFVAKLCQNSLYGKTIQTNDRDGIRVSANLFNPMYAAIITAGCRMRCAEIIRVNGHENVISVATDGVIFQESPDLVVPENPKPVFFDGERINLGDWEADGNGTLLMMMSGVYSMLKGAVAKSTYRGSYSMFLDRKDEEGNLITDHYGTNWLEFCARYMDEEKVERTEEINPTMRPYSLGEAKVRNDYTLTNKFRIVDLSISACGDSNKRRWNEKPITFGDLLETWWPSETWESMI